VQRIDSSFDEGYTVAWLTLFISHLSYCLITAPCANIARVLHYGIVSGWI